MKLALTIIIVCLTLKITEAQNILVGNATGEAKAGAMTAETGLNSIGYNPAGIYSSDFGASLTYFDWYGTKELSQKSATVAIPALKGCFSGGFDYYGFQLYNEIKASLGYGMRLNKNLKAGIRLNYNNLHIDDSGDNENAATCELGIIYSPLEKMDLGFTINNPTNKQFNESDTVIITSITIGLKYKFYNTGILNLDVEKRANNDKIDIKLGMEGKLSKYFNVLGGIGSDPARACVGMGFEFDQMKINVAFIKNEYLGWTPTISVSWDRNLKK